MQRSLRQSVRRLFIGSRWRAFAGLHADEFAESLEKAFKMNDIKSTKKKKEPSSTERFVLGSYNEVQIYELSNKDGENITIKVIPISLDPVSRLTFKIFGTGERLKQIKQSSVVDVHPIESSTEEFVRSIFSSLIQKSSHKPWDLSHHPRFTTGFILDWKTRELWRFWESK